MKTNTHTHTSTSTPNRRRRTLRTVLVSGAAIATAAVFAIAAPALADDHTQATVDAPVTSPRIVRADRTPLPTHTLDHKQPTVDRKLPRLTLADPAASPKLATPDADEPISRDDKNKARRGHDLARGKGHTRHGNGLGLGHDKHDCQGTDDHEDHDDAGKPDKARKDKPNKGKKADKPNKGKKADKPNKGKKRDTTDRAPKL